MQKYELLAIIPAIHTDTEVPAIADKVVAIVTAAGGTIVRSENLGKLKLAYPIKHQKHGYYWLVQFDAEGAVVAKIENDLRLSEHVLRHMLTERAEGADKARFQLEAYVSPISEEGFATRKEKPRRKAGEVAPAATSQVAPRGPEMTVEELDKKLDQILEGASENV